MKRLLCLVLCLFLALPAKAQDAFESDLRRLLGKYKVLGACVAVVQNGEVTHVYPYGVQKPGGRAVTGDTLFQVGSISKMITGLGLMQLLEQQGIPLDTDICDILGYSVRHYKYPNEPITLRQVMSHTASLRDSKDYAEALAGHEKPLRELFAKKNEYVFLSLYKPGTKRQYSNFGGGIAGCLMEAISGQTVDAYMKEHVFDPLNMQAAYQPNMLPEERLADLYHMPQKYLAKRLHDDAPILTQPDPESHYTFTAGKLTISAPDLARLMAALCDGGSVGNVRLLSEKATEEMLTPQNNRGSVTCETNNGLFINIVADSVVSGRTLYGHGGKANGMLCAAYMDPTDRTGVVMLTNGCANESTFDGVGMLSRQVISLCYHRLIDPEHIKEDAFLVE